MGQHFYLDTGILVPLLWDRDDDQANHCNAVIDELRGKVRSQDHEVIIPNLVVGETLSLYFRDVQNGEVGIHHRPDSADFLADFYAVVEDLNPHFAPIPSKCVHIARELHRDDRELGFNDLYIASMALYDEHSSYLLALDGDLIRTNSIPDKSREMLRDGERNHRLKVQPSLSE